MGSSKQNVGLALIAALFVHGLLLAQKLVFKEPPVSSSEPLRITILEEKDSEPSVEPQADNTPVEVNKPVAVPEIVDELIVATKPSTQAEPRIVVQTSPHSRLFKNWLQTETDNFTNQNPDAVDEFDQTFDEPLPYESPKELSSSNPKSYLKGSTTFKVEDNGRRTCLVKIIDLLDVSASPSYTSRDCTPEKKFDLKLNQPNNGWSDR